jgi:uncharacterized protein (DUF1810 family)
MIKTNQPPRNPGRFTTAVKYGIESIDEVQAYLAHPVLRNRLLKCIELVC